VPKNCYKDVFGKTFKNLIADTGNQQFGAYRYPTIREKRLHASDCKDDFLYIRQGLHYFETEVRESKPLT
jgi:hypothetical protein